MKQQEIEQDTAYAIHEKKKYSKPELTILGKVSQLTAGGSSGFSECENPGDEASCDRSNMSAKA